MFNTATFDFVTPLTNYDSQIIYTSAMKIMSQLLLENDMEELKVIICFSLLVYIDGLQKAENKNIILHPKLLCE